jgi:hypothetical protein
MKWHPVPLAIAAPERADPTTESGPRRSQQLLLVLIQAHQADAF